MRALDEVIAESASAIAHHRHAVRRELAARLKLVLCSSISDIGVHVTDALLAGNTELAERLESERRTVRIVMSTIDSVVCRLIQDNREHAFRPAIDIEADTKPPGALAEGGFAALKDVADGLTDARFPPACHVADWRQAARRVRASFRHDDLVRVGVDDQVGVVRDHDHLTFRFRRDEERDQFVEDGFRIEVLLGLVDDQRSIV